MVERLDEDREISVEPDLSTLATIPERVQKTGKVTKQRTIGSNVRRQHIRLLPAVEVAAPVALGRAKDEVVKLVAEVNAIPWPSRTGDTNDGIERKEQELLTSSFRPRRKPACCWSFNGLGWCRISVASQRRGVGAIHSTLVQLFTRIPNGGESSRG